MNLRDSTAHLGCDTEKEALPSLDNFPLLVAINEVKYATEDQHSSPARSIVVYALSSHFVHFERLRTLALAMPSVAFIAVIEEPTEVERASIAGAIESLPHVTIITLDVTLGKGAALRAGYNACAADFICFLDLDAVIDPKIIETFFDFIERRKDVDGVVGDRWLRGRAAGRTRRRLVSRAFSLFARALFRIAARDPQSPVKVFRRQALGTIFDDLRLYNHGFDVELLFQARRKMLRIAERAIDWTDADRPWPIVRTGATVASALLSLRILTSPLGRLPGVVLLGRHYVLPVKRRYAILLFSWRDPGHLGAGGAEVYLHEQAKHWTRAGHRVTWFAQRTKGAAGRERLDGIDIVRVGSFPSVFVLASLWYVFRSGRDFDCLIDCMNGIPFFTPLFSTKPKVCLVHHIHSHHFRQELRFPLSTIAVFLETKFVPFLYRNVRFMTVSPSTKAEMESLAMSRFPIKIIHNGVSPELRPGTKSRVPTILYLGRLKRYKRIRKLIDAFARVKEAVPDARLIIAGTGDDEQPLREYASIKHVPDVDFLGHVSEDVKLRLLRESWVLGMPSEIEGWGIVVIEASACGTPAVIYRVPGLTDSVVERETGLIADDDAEYAAKIIEILKDDILRGCLSEQCIQWAGQFSWEDASRRTLDQIRISQPWYAVFESSPDEHLSLRRTEFGDRSGRLSRHPPLGRQKANLKQ